MLAYVLIALIGTQVRGRELFPFFNWSLFSTTSNPRSDTVLIVRSANGVEFDEPRLFYSMGDTFSAAATRTSRVAKALDVWAGAIRRKDADAESKMRRLVEGTYLREAKALEYDLARITYDPIERLETGEISQTKILASYEKRDVR